MGDRRGERLYPEARLQVRRGRCKKVPVADRQPPGPKPPNEVRSANCVFDQTAGDRVLKWLTIVDDAPRSRPGGADPGDWRQAVTPVFDEMASTRGLPQVLRTDKG